MAVDMFLKVEGIDGESQDSSHKNEIEIESYSFGGTQTGTFAHGGGGGAGKVSMHDFSFVLRHSKASPKLMEAMASGQHIKSATLTCRKAGKTPQDFMKVTMSDVLVSSYHSGHSSSAGEIPVDQASLNFAKIEHEYKEQKADGTVGGAVKGSWDLKKNKT